MAFISQRRRNTCIGIIQHGLMNFGLFLVLLRGVIGEKHMKNDSSCAILSPISI